MISIGRRPPLDACGNRESTWKDRNPTVKRAKDEYDERHPDGGTACSPDRSFGMGTALSRRQRGRTRSTGAVKRETLYDSGSPRPTGETAGRSQYTLKFDVAFSEGEFHQSGHPRQDALE